MTTPALVFDVGSTLIHPDFSTMRDWLAARSPVRASVHDIEYAFRRAISGDIFSAANGTAAEAMHFFQLAGCPPDSIDQWPSWWREIVRSGGAGSWLYTCVYPETREILRELSASGFRLIAASNSDGTLRDELLRFQLLEFFEAIFDSHDLKIEKPAPAFYRHVLANIGCPRCVHIGDDLIKDVLGPMSSGFNAALLYDPADVYPGAPASMKVRRLCDVTDALRRVS
jgi:FMN phosphatase YigB (HAD superfamily)